MTNMLRSGCNSLVTGHKYCINQRYSAHRRMRQHQRHHQLQQQQQLHWVHTRAMPRVFSSKTSQSSSSSSGSESRHDGWNFLFDLRERETEWTEENKARLMAIVTAQQLHISMSEMETRLDALVLLLPDLAGRLPQLHPDILSGLVSDLPSTSSKLLLLRELLPSANVSALVAHRPQLLLQDEDQLAAAVEQLRRLLNVDRVDKLVESQPLLLVTECVEEVLDEIRRLMPTADAQQLLAADPDWVLRVQRGQRWLGQHPDSDMGELINWKPPQQYHHQQQQQRQGPGS